MDSKPVDLSKDAGAGTTPASAVNGTRPAAGPGGRPGRPGRPAAAPLPKIPVPITVTLASIAIGVHIVFTIGRALALRGYTSELMDWLRVMNGKAKKPVADYTPDKVAHDLGQLRSGTLLQALVLSAALALLALSLRRVRGASGARWALIIILVLTSGPMAVVPVSGWPMLPKLLGVGTGVASIAVIVLILLPKSVAYFRACKDAVRPPGSTPRPGGLASLFAPKPRPGQAGGRTAGGRTGATRMATTRTATSDRQAQPGGAAARRSPKAKVRADSDSVAKGAELARARAKASKSRRTPDK